jgi:hypothetical protein
MKIFSICHRCEQHEWCTLACVYLRSLQKNLKWDTQRGLGETNFVKKKPEVKNLVALSL